MNFHRIGFYGNTPSEVLTNLSITLPNYKQIKIDVPKYHLSLVKELLSKIPYNIKPDYSGYLITIIKGDEEGGKLKK